MMRLVPLALTLVAGCTSKTSTLPERREVPPSLAEICGDVARPPRVEAFGTRVLVAIGYDLGNVVLIRTDAGNVIVDAGMSPERAAAAKEALLARAPGKIVKLIYTHSHLDHVGGAAAWVDLETEVWASDRFPEQFAKQYGLFQPIETVRGLRQYGFRVTPDVLPCSSIGPLPDVRAALNSGARMPTKGFSGTHAMTVGGVAIHLIEARGETQDQIMVWLPEERVLMAGDNIFRAFPNVYTIRGTNARPVNDWIQSLDKMRALAPMALVPGHTSPITGEAAVQETLTAYRDAMQWVRDATVRGANAGIGADALAETVRLPPHLANHPYLAETYGQVDWAVRAVYSESLGWFSGDADRLYTLPRRETSGREVEMMGGPAAVVDAAEKALAQGDARWATHLLGKVRESGGATGSLHDRMIATMAKSYDLIAAATINTNGRGYLAESAVELREGRAPFEKPNPDEGFLRDLPIEVFLKGMAVRLRANDSTDVLEALQIDFEDLERSFTITVRRGVAEVAEGRPFPGMPAPVVTLKIDSLVWKKLAMKQEKVATLITTGQMTIEGGGWMALAQFFRRFDVD